MGRKGISLADVASACAVLARQRRALGPNNIRLELGRGSFSTIAQHLRRLALVNPRVPRRPRLQRRAR
jgi:predicted nucleotidyltransferase